MGLSVSVMHAAEIPACARKPSSSGAHHLQGLDFSALKY